jgi:type IV secretory pathway TraG/TraD family ATPase VirD4
MTELMWMVVLAAAGWGCWRAGKTGPALVFTGGTGLVLAAIAREIAAWLGTGPAVVLAVMAGLLLLAAIAVHQLLHHRHRARRWGRAVRRKDGMASTLDVLRFGSSWAMRRQATRVRPSLAEVSRAERMRLPVTEFALPLCHIGLQRVYASNEDTVLAVGIPRYGKTAWVTGQVLDAPGAVVVTSTKPDIYEATRALRAEKDAPVWVMNPTGVGGIASTAGFNPLTGCEDPVTCGHRAEDMLPCPDADGDGPRWIAMARNVFAGLLHAAALGGHDLSVINRWVADPKPTNAGEEVEQLLAGVDASADAYATAAQTFFSTNDRTRTSIVQSMMPAFAWLPNPHARACADTSRLGEFNVAELLRTRGTVYVLGSEDGSTASLVAAFTGYIAREARRIADMQPGGRLDPTLRLVLDEAAIICPLPLDRWSADMGSRGIQMCICCHSRAQMIGRWGTTGAASLINNTGALLLYGGCKDQNDLSFWSSLFGERDEEIVTTNRQGEVTSRSVRRVPVFSPAQLASLPKFRVVVWRSSMLPVLGTVEKFWTRPAYRAQQDALKRAERDVLASVGASTAASTAAATPRSRRPASGVGGALRRRRERRAVKASTARARSTL